MIHVMPTTIQIPTLGTIDGLLHPGGVRQFCGIPYASLKERWTRSELLTSWPEGHHDGRQHGPVVPAPPEWKVDIPIFPVPPLAYFREPVEHEFECLSLNIVLPPGAERQSLPVMVWIHGGSFLFGHSSQPDYDMVNLVSYASSRGSPVIGVSINYRVGLFGFLASEAIKSDLSSRGSDGVGNFGLTDQQVALEWIQRYIASFGGDPTNVTISGESAGGMSVAHQVWAAHPVIFKRAMSMSGTTTTIPVWPLHRHEQRWRNLLAHFSIDPAADHALERLRQVPQDKLVEATCPIEGHMLTTGNPCYDDWFFDTPPLTSTIRSPPAWLNSYMIGDVKDEAMIFRIALDDISYSDLHTTLSKHLPSALPEAMLALYDIIPSTSTPELIRNFQSMATEILFTLPNWRHANVSNIPKTYLYHFDQVSTLDHSLKGLAYHGVDLLYLFRNMMGSMTDEQRRLSDKIAGDFLDFAYGRDPWERFSVRRGAMVYGPESTWSVKIAAEDAGSGRDYARMQKVLETGKVDELVTAIDEYCVRRWFKPV
ncbi:Carboxylesterase-like protein 2 [Elsinoe fawcettii]|nr:Carboxylesterase-like protein 2 [Elsinoe fawcettii]